MAITVKHKFVSAIPDAGDTTIVQPSNWNDDHTLIGLGTMAEQNANAVAITGGTISGVTLPASNITGTLGVPNGGTGATTLTGYVKGTGTTAMTASATIPNTDITGLGTASTKDAGAALGVATLDAGGKVPQSQIPLMGDLNYQGTWNASTNTPALTSSVGTKGYYYVVDVSGNTNLNGITDWVIGDWAIFNGSIWQKVDNTDAVTSVNGQVGTVVLTQSDISGTVPTTRTITAGTGLTGGGDLSANRTLAIDSTVATLTGSQTLTNKTISGANNTLTNIGNSSLTNSAITINGTSTSLGGSINVGTVTSVGLTSSASSLAITNTPITSSGNIGINYAGIASQYVRGDGSLANFPTTTGGGSSVSYYFNGSVNQGTFGGNTYYQMSKTPVFGTGTNFSINANGYIAQFITDANDPSLLAIPAGNWNFEMYFSTSSAGGTPNFYLELYKYNGTTFTLIASGSTNPEGITGGVSTDLYITSLGVPATTLAVTDRLAVRVYVNHSGRTITLHTEDNNLCQVITTFSTGLNALNGLTAQVQYFATGTSGSDFNISSATDTHTFNLPSASGSNRGLLTSTDWTTFNSKVTSVSGTTGRITSSGGTTPAIDLASGIVTAGTTGSSTLIPVITVDTYGRVTSVTTASNPQGTVTSVTGTSPVVSSGGATPAISLASGYGDTLNPYASKTANFVLAAPNGSAGVPTFRAIVAADIPTLNQNTTGTASNVTGTVAVANGGTGLTSLTANRVPYGNGTSAYQSSANLTFNGTTLTATDITDSSLTAGRVTYAGTGGNLVDSTNLTFDGVGGLRLGGTNVLGAGNATGQKNYLDNGNFDIWQAGRVASSTVATNILADRWQYINDGTLSNATVFSRQTFTPGQTDVPNNPTYFLQVQYTSVNTPSNYIRQRIENVATLSGQTATISAWVRVTSGTIACNFQYQQEFGTGGSPGTPVYGIGVTNFTATTTWTRFTATVAIPSISGKGIGTNNDSALNACIVFPATGSATVQISQVQVEIGSVATSYDIKNIQTELARCQRYYLAVGSTGSITTWGGGVDGTGGASSISFGQFPVTMRANPTVGFSGISYFSAATGAVAFTVAGNRCSTTTGAISVTCNTGTPVGGQACVLYIPTSGYIQFGAEL